MTIGEIPMAMNASKGGQWMNLTVRGINYVPSQERHQLRPESGDQGLHRQEAQEDRLCGGLSARPGHRDKEGDQGNRLPHRRFSALQVEEREDRLPGLLRAVRGHRADRGQDPERRQEGEGEGDEHLTDGGRIPDTRSLNDDPCPGSSSYNPALLAIIFSIG